jgi:hypothetical protein
MPGKRFMSGRERANVDALMEGSPEMMIPKGKQVKQSGFTPIDNIISEAKMSYDEGSDMSSVLTNIIEQLQGLLSGLQSVKSEKNPEKKQETQ